MSASVYFTKATVTRTLSLYSVEQRPVQAASATLTVVDTNENTPLISSQTLSVAPGDTKVTYTVDSVHNTLSPSTEGFDGRSVTIEVIDTSGDTHVFTDRYIVRLVDPYVVGKDIPCTLLDADFAAYQAGIGSWMQLEDTQKETALLNVFATLKCLKFKICDENCQPCVFKLGNLSPEEYANLPADLVTALIGATITQANFDQSCTSYEQQRQSGLMSSSSGDSSHFFRAGKPIEYPLSKAAMMCLKDYVIFGTAGICRR